MLKRIVLNVVYLGDVYEKFNVINNAICTIFSFCGELFWIGFKTNAKYDAKGAGYAKLYAKC